MKKDIKPLARPHILSMKPYSSARDEFKEFDKAMVFLDANESPFTNGLNRYPDPQQHALKSQLAKLKNLNPDQILLGNGSDEVLDLMYRVFCEPKTDHVITLPPTYGMYAVLAETNQVENREIRLTANFQPDADVILKTANSQSKLLFLCSPNNPSGNDFDQQTVLKLLENFPGIVVIDEAYVDFADRDSWTNYLSQFENLIVVQTLSKAYAHAGIRLGMAFASPEIIGYLNKIKPPYNVNQLTQLSAWRALQNTDEVAGQIKVLLSERKKMSAFLKTINFVKKVYPSDANFLLVKMDDAPRRYQQFLAQGIVLRDRSKQPLCENALRITIGTPEENVKLQAAFRSIVNEG